ncbi:MAG TPA: CHASE2 domain-containing protein [Rhizomicrobium sp.]|nr:CHASE2 domain-containing protein [Rhizomicrobium sp.]
MSKHKSNPPRGPVGRVIARARKPNKEHVETLRLRVPFWFVFVFLFVFASYQIIMNPFGFSDLVQRYTQDISDLLITGPYLYPQDGHEKISVALVDDQTLSQLQMPWPWSYGAQARALDALLAYKPRAVIVDILFVDPRKDDTLSDLTEEIHRYKQAGVPLYFSGATDLPPGEPPVRKELLDAGARVLDPTLISQGIARQYPVDAQCLGKQPAGSTCKSMALQVYSDLYPQQPLKVNPDGVMELVWGTRADPYNTKWMDLSESCDQKLSFFRRIYLAFFDPSQVRARCPYTSVIPVQTLLQGTDDPDVPKLATGRVIFYGGELEGTQDNSFSPVNGKIANVFVHAMAMDNLITFRGRPEQNVVTAGSYTLDNNTVQVIAIIPVILILAWIHILNLRERERKKSLAGKDRSEIVQYFLEQIVESVWHWGAWILSLGAGLALTLFAGLSVANWVEVVFVSVELAAMLLVGLPDAVWGYLHHVVRGLPELDNPQEENS